MDGLPPQERELNTPSFEANLQDVLTQAEQLPGSFTIEGNRWYAYIVYHDENELAGPIREAADPRSATHITDIRPVPGADPESVLDYARSHQDFFLARARQNMTTRRKARALIDALRQPDLEPDNFATITEHGLRMMPDLVAAYNAHDQLYYSDIAQATLRRALDLTPETATQTFNAIAAQCNRYREGLDEDGAALVDRFTNSMAARLETMVSEGRLEAIDSQPRAEEWRYDSQSENIEENALIALEVFDEANLVSHKFWRRLLKIPLQSQSLAVTNLLAEKLHSEVAKDVLKDVSGIERSQAIENAVGAALERAKASHNARDPERVDTIRRAIAASRERPDTVSLGKLVSLANKVIAQNYKDELTPLRTESSLADSAQALALLLQITLRPDAAPDELAQANSEAAIFLRLISGIVENAKIKQEPVIKTVGDLALRFADATPTELRLLRQALGEGGVSQADALRKQQLRSQRRARINRPGYGKIS